MRLWSLHPSCLDAKGLVALWREALLAKAVLEGRTAGYRNHPQLKRFRESSDPLGGINRYLSVVWEEASSRGYSFDPSKFNPEAASDRIPVTAGQIGYEMCHLLAKLARRDPARGRDLGASGAPPPVHPLFCVVPGPVEEWERTGA